MATEENGKPKEDALMKTADGVFGTGAAFNLAQREAKSLCSSSLVPKAYQNNIPNTLIAIEAARRTGASVLAIMQNLYIVHGRPAFEAKFMIATVNACGRFSPLRYRMQGDPQTIENMEWGCRAVANDKESGEELVGPLVTIGMADKEGWLSKIDKHGQECSKWQTMPELMLHYRAAAFWQRIYAPELSLGMHTREEIEDIPIKVEATREPEITNLDQLADQLKGGNGNVEQAPETPDPEQEAETQNNFDRVHQLAQELWGESYYDELNQFVTDLGFNYNELGDLELKLLRDALEQRIDPNV